jgi:class 3 adenylate cyclase
MLARFLNRLGSFARVIRFDFIGIGLSDPVSPSTPPTLEQWADDAIAVLDAVHSETAAVLACAEVGQVAVLLAASHPERVESLVLVNSFARAVRAPDYPWGFEAVGVDDQVAAFVDPDDEQDFDYVSDGSPSVASNTEFRDWWDRAGNRGASPSMATASLNVTLRSDVRGLLPSVSVPTLVAHRVDNVMAPVGFGQYLADNIPGARFLALPGVDDLMWVGDPEPLLDEVQEFLTGVPPAPPIDRVLATVLFTDIVSSTEQATAMGDRTWRDVLDRHDAIVRRQLERFNGREINTTGDGFIATFDGPARGIHCGRAIRDGTRQLGIDLRIGLHTGEVELRGDDVAGVAVHLAARVAAKAQGGEVLVSRTVKDLVAGSGITFTARGEHALKGVDERWELFAVDAAPGV